MLPLIAFYLIACVLDDSLWRFHGVDAFDGHVELNYLCHRRGPNLCSVTRVRQGDAEIPTFLSIHVGVWIM